MPVNLPKVKELLFEVAHLGYELNGQEGRFGVSTERTLEIVGIGLVLLFRDTAPLLWFQVFG